MRNEMVAIMFQLQDTLEGSPWFGRPVYSILDEIDPARAKERPKASSHSLLDLIYHMNTWADFTLKSIEKDPSMDLDAFEKIDWRVIDPSIHNWKDAVEEYKSIHKKILNLLESRDDDFLDEKVEFKKYNFRFLLNGLNQHNIYHIGQIAYLNKSFEK